ncbi:MAG: site-specific integrase [Ruminococcus sp.]|nr:site-specific integrase [Ruminococcus sp.]
MNCIKLKNGKFSAVISLGVDDNGKRIYKRITAKTKWEVEKQAEELRSKTKDLKSLDLTVKEAMTEYVDSRSNLIEATTLRNYHEMIRNRLKTIQAVKINKLCIVDIQKAVNKEASSGLSRRTIKNGVDLLKASLEFFDIKINFKKLQLPKDRPNSSENLPEVEKIFSALKGSSIEVYCYIALNGCMRIGELLGLKYSDIDFENHTIHIHRTQAVTEDGTVYRDYCKTPKSIRTVEISAELCNRIKMLPHGNDDEYVVPLTRKALYSRYSRIMKRNGLPTSFHLLRKMSASVLHAQGMPDKYILYLGGWSTDNVLKSVYEKTFESERDLANKRAVACFEKINEQINQNSDKSSNQIR